MRSSGARITVLAVVGACAGTLPSVSVVDSLRLFALTTPTPDVLPNASVRVTAVWYDPTPSETVFFHWRVCPEPVSGDARDCAQPAAGTDLTVETTGVVDLPPAMLVLPAGATSSDVIVYVAICPGAPSVYDAALGHYNCASPEGIEAERRVYLHTAPPLNNDPGIAAFTVGDGTTVRSLTVQPAAGSAEMIPGGGEESLEASYFVTAGTIDAPRAIGVAGSTAPLTVHWTPPTGMSGSTVLLWVVLRDQRGGDTVAQGSVVLP